MICLFNKLKHPKFECGLDRLAYEEWLRKMENVFEIMEYPKRFRYA